MASPFYMPEARVLADIWSHRMHEIGSLYLQMVEDGHETTAEEDLAWRTLADETRIHARAVRQTFEVLTVNVDEPYYSSKSMAEMMRDTGQLLVSARNCEHPIWTLDANIDFRTVHDGMGHYLSGGAFSWQGELDACSIHLRMIRDPLARRALFTECIGQVAAFYVGGKVHAPQVCGFLPEHLTQGYLHA